MDKIYESYNNILVELTKTSGQIAKEKIISLIFKYLKKNKINYKTNTSMGTYIFTFGSVRASVDNNGWLDINGTSYLNPSDKKIIDKLNKEYNV